MAVARVEAALHEAGESRILVGTARQLRAVAADEPGAVVIVVLTAAPEVARGVRMLRDWSRSVTAIALSPEPGALWTAVNRALGLRASLPLAATPAELGAAVRALRAGLFIVHPDVLIASGRRSAGGIAGAALTAREREILELMAEGASNAMIAARLGISRHTAKFHVAAILGKVGARTRAEAVALALRHGLF